MIATRPPHLALRLGLHQRQPCNVLAVEVKLLKKPFAGFAFSDHEGGDGEAFRRAAYKHGLEGIVSKRIDRPYLPATAAPGSKASASIGQSSSLSGGPTQEAPGLSLGRFCSATTSRMAG
jgi:hypothetical protein